MSYQTSKVARKRTANKALDTEKKAKEVENHEDDVYPLSKKINRLNIEYSSSSQGANSQDGNFGDKYPYDPGSTYYRPNELLNSLHEERMLRNQQAALHKALNSHLKL